MSYYGVGKVKDFLDFAAQNTRSEQEAKPGDIEILQSIPGVDMFVLGTLLGETYELLCRRDYDSLRCFAGTDSGNMVRSKQGELYT